MKLLLSANAACEQLGVRRENFDEIAKTLCLTPIPLGKRILWSALEIRHRLTHFDKGSFPKLAEQQAPESSPAEEPVVIDDGRTRAPRQAFMRQFIGKA